MAAPEAMMARGRSNWRDRLRRRGFALRVAIEQNIIIRKIGRAAAETGTGPMRENRLERTLSQLEPPPQPGMAAPLKDCQSRNDARAAASNERVATEALM